MLFAYIKKQIRKFFSDYGWELAYGEYDESFLRSCFSLSKVKIVKNPYVDKWFADPFILSEDEKDLQLLVEEFDKKINKGRIARIKIDKESSKIIEFNVILEKDTHLSFPAIYYQDNTIFVHPENSAAGQSIIYRYDNEKDKLVDPIVINESPLTDAVIDYKNDGYYMYSTMLPNNSGPLLYVYKSKEFLGPYEKIDEINVNDHTARMAGGMICSGNDVIRPAQDCNHDYGEAVIFYRDNNIIGELRPRDGHQFAGIHTFNKKGSTFIIDIKKYNHPNLRFYTKCFLDMFK